MPRKEFFFCAAANCEEIHHLFTFPSNAITRQKWVDWVRESFRDFKLIQTSRLCWRHFHKEDIRNYTRYVLGAENRMYLRTDREVLPGYVVPDDMPTPRKKHVFTPTKEERESIISSLLSDPEPSAKKSRRALALGEGTSSQSDVHQQTGGDLVIGEQTGSPSEVPYSETTEVSEVSLLTPVTGIAAPALDMSSDLPSPLQSQVPDPCLPNLDLYPSSPTNVEPDDVLVHTIPTLSEAVPTSSTPTNPVQMLLPTHQPPAISVSPAPSSDNPVFLRSLVQTDSQTRPRGMVDVPLRVYGAVHMHSQACQVDIVKQANIHTQTEYNQTGIKNFSETRADKRLQELEENKTVKRLQSIKSPSQPAKPVPIVIVPAPSRPSADDHPPDTSPDTSEKASSSSSAPTIHEYGSSEYEASSEENVQFIDDMEENELVYKTLGTSWYDEKKFIVCQDNLLQLLKPCIRCGMEALVEQQQAYGCYVPFKISCQSDKCGHVREWANSEKVNGVPILNLLLCATILFTGCLPTKFLRAFNFLNVSTVSPGTFFKYQREYLHGVVREVYEKRMAEERAKLQQPLKLNGDGRFDSPGHSAMYGIYTFMCAATSKIVANSLVKCTETTSSSAMELEGLKRCRAYLDLNNVAVEQLTTDRHVSVKAYMKNSWKAVKHYFDTWHLTKGLRKKLNKLSTKKVGFKQIGRWIPAIIAHLWHVITNTAPGDQRMAWWKSCANHICNIHDLEGDGIGKCKHPDEEVRYNEQGEELVVEWIVPDTQLDLETRKVLWEKGFMEAINMASGTSTGELESFHGELNRNAPKMEGFSYSGMLSRTQLTILQHNENCQRSVKMMASDPTKPRKVIHRSKATKQTPTVQFVREDATYSYIDDMYKCLDGYVKNRTRPLLNDIEPPTLASKGPQYDSIEEVEAEMEKKRRGGLAKPHHITLTQRYAESRGRSRGRGRGNISGAEQQATPQPKEQPGRGRPSSAAAAEKQATPKPKKQPGRGRSSSAAADDNLSQVIVTSKKGKAKGKAPMKGKSLSKKSS